MYLFQTWDSIALQRAEDLQTPPILGHDLAILLQRAAQLHLAPSPSPDGHPRGMSGAGLCVWLCQQVEECWGAAETLLAASYTTSALPGVV